MLLATGILATVLAVCCAPALAAGPNSTLLISRPSGLGALPIPGDGDASIGRNAISGDGARIVFLSGADDLGVRSINFHAWVRDTLADTTRLVDRVPGGGEPGNRAVFDAAISRNGSTVCLLTEATNLVAGVTGLHVFVVTLSSGAIAVADRAAGAGGALGNDLPNGCALDETGTRVVFQSRATNLVLNDTNGATDVFVRDLATSSNTRVSTDSTGAQTPNGGNDPDINTDGTRIAFVSRDALIAGDDNGVADVYVRDTQANTLVRASVGTGSVQSEGGASSDPALDDDGTHVAFASRATNLDLGADTNGVQDIFWRDFGSDTTIAVSRATGGAGELADADCSNPAISGDGLGVAFDSDATNLGGGLPQRRLAYLRRLGTNETFALSRADGAVGAPADRFSARVSLADVPSMSAWVSTGSNLDPDASGEFSQVFKRDLSAEPSTVLVSRPTGTAPRSAAVNFSFVGPRAISADGRFVTFASLADGLDPAAAGRLSQVFVRDTVTDTLTLVSRGPGPAGVVADGDSSSSAISADGTHVVFFSRATNLLPGITLPQVYIRDLATEELEVASRADGVAGTLAAFASGSDRPDISGAGRKVVFGAGDALVSADDNSNNDIYLRDLDAGTTTLASVTAGGAAAGGNFPALSDDGMRVAFGSNASDVLGGTPILGNHVYVRDLGTGTTVLADRRANDGEPGTGNAQSPEISGAGNRVAFFADEALTPDAISPRGALYVRDLGTDTTILAGRGDGPGGAAAAAPFNHAISRDGARVSFTSDGAGLPGPADTLQVYVRDLGTNTTTLASAADGTATTAGNANAGSTALSAGGGCVAFDSQADNLTTPAYATQDFRQIYLRAVTGECPEQTAPPPPSGTPLVAKSVVLRPGKLLKLVVDGMDPLVADPTAGGGNLTVTGATGAASYDLPATGWKAVGRRKPKGFKFKGAECRASLLRKRIKATCRGATGSLGLPEPGPLAIVLAVGVQDAEFCAVCGGKARGKPERIFKRKRCDAPAACP